MRRCLARITDAVRRGVWAWDGLARGERGGWWSPTACIISVRLCLLVIIAVRED